MTTTHNINLGMDYQSARSMVLGYYKDYTIEHAAAILVAQDVLAGGDLHELTEEKIGTWTVAVIGEQGARAFRFAVMFYVLYPNG